MAKTRSLVRGEVAGTSSPREVVRDKLGATVCRATASFALQFAPSPRKDTVWRDKGGCGGWCPWVREKTSVPAAMANPMDVIALSALTMV